ncbi:phytanoyl-CoA dioxygenase family protein, partial [Seonamhaeicola sp.]|uniref:phytanoyl-CoA dioxygenase family protein n=1 Tax=Seonamhaeicola sp. TaxID=1912245 RepID=UPI00260F1F2C
NNHLTCWVGLDDASEDNGCLYFVPGSHKWGLLPITGLTGDMDAVRKVLTPEQNKAMDNKFANVLKKGYASFHHPICMHGSYTNASNRQRRAVVLNVMADGTRSNVDALKRPEDLQGFPIIPQDEKMAGTFYPVLFDKDMELIKTIIDEIPTINDFD